MSSKYSVVIIGSGPAGLSAAIYLKRANIDFVLIESSTPGGQLNRSSIIENYPGFNEIDGPTLAYNMFSQATNLGTKVIFDKVIDIKEEGSQKKVLLSSENILCDYIIIASGRRPRPLPLSNYEKYIGKGLSYCALCDGFFYKDQNVAIVGGGNTALEEALYLANLCKKVTIIYRGDTFKGEELMIEKVKSTSNIKILYNQEVTELYGEEKLTSLKLKNDEVLKVEALFVAIGNLPNSEFINIVNKENDYILVDENYQTSVKNIYAAGDIIKKNTYQIVTAVAEGASAANKIINELRSN